MDTDYGAWTLPDGSWDEHRMDQLLSSRADVVVSGTVDNQVKFYERFDRVVLLSVPLDIAIQRVSTRADNPYGRTEHERTEIARYTEEVEPLLRQSATDELDGRMPVGELADAVVAMVMRPNS